MAALFALCFRARIFRAMAGTYRRSCFASGKLRSLITSTMSSAVSHLSGALPCRSELRLGIEINHGWTNPIKSANSDRPRNYDGCPNENEPDLCRDQRLFFRPLLFSPPLRPPFRELDLLLFLPRPLPLFLPPLSDLL